MLFEETFFNSNNHSFTVLCIDQPLEGGIGTTCMSVNVQESTVVIKIPEI